MPLPYSPLHYFIAGLLVSEGSFGKKKHRNPGRFTFTNTDPKLVKIVYDFLVKELNIPKNLIKIYITYNQEITSIPKKTLKEYWIKTLNAPQETIKIYPYKRKVKQIRKRAKYGICQIRINNIKTRKKIENFIKETLTKLQQQGVGEGHRESP